MKTKPTKRNRNGPSMRLLGDVLLEHIKGGIESAWYHEWEKVKKELRGEVYAHLRGFDEVWIEVIDGCAGETWWEIRLRDLVTELMKDRDGAYDAAEQADWHDALAADLEKQASRLRKCAAKIRPPNADLSDASLRAFAPRTSSAAVEIAENLNKMRPKNK